MSDFSNFLTTFITNKKLQYGNMRAQCINMHYFKQHFARKKIEKNGKNPPSTIGDKTFGGLISRIAPQQIGLCKVKQSCARMLKFKQISRSTFTGKVFTRLFLIDIKRNYSKVSFSPRVMN